MTVLDARQRLEQVDANEISIVMLNAACGHTLDEIAAAARAKGWAAVIHSTNTHITTRTGADTYQQGKIQLFIVGVYSVEDALLTSLKLAEPGPGMVHFPRRLDAENFRHLTAERVITRFEKGRPICF